MKVNIAGEGLLNLDILFCTDGLSAERDFIVLHVRNAGLQFLCSYPKICPSTVVFWIKQGLQRAFYYMDFHWSTQNIQILVFKILQAFKKTQTILVHGLSYWILCSKNSRTLGCIYHLMSFGYQNSGELFHKWFGNLRKEQVCTWTYYLWKFWYAFFFKPVGSFC